MINEADRQALIAYRLEQAKEAADLVLFLIEHDKLTVAVNRIYYGMYYALTALALKNKFETSKHAQLIGWFNKNFVANGEINPNYGKILRNAFQNRRKGDYDAFVAFEKEEVTVMHREMLDFIDATEELLK